MAPKPIIKIIRPQLTEQERAERMDELKKALIDFWIEADKAKHKAKEESA